MEHTRKVTISLPRALAARVESLRRSDQRTRSGVLQEALRVYFDLRAASARPAVRPTARPRVERAPAPTPPPALPRPDEHERRRMGERMLEQSRLSQSLHELRAAFVRRGPARGTT